MKNTFEGNVKTLMLMSFLLMASCVAQDSELMSRGDYLQSKKMTRQNCPNCQDCTDDVCDGCCEALARKKKCPALCIRRQNSFCKSIKSKEDPRCNPTEDAIRAKPQKAFKYKNRCPGCGCIDRNEYLQRFNESTITANGKVNPDKVYEFAELETNRTYCDWDAAYRMYEEAMTGECPVCADPVPKRCSRKPCTKRFALGRCKKCGVCTDDIEGCDICNKVAHFWNEDCGEPEEENETSISPENKRSRNLMEKGIHCAALVSQNHGSTLDLLDWLCQPTCTQSWDFDDLASEGCCTLSDDEEECWDGCVVDWSGYCSWGRNLGEEAPNGQIDKDDWATQRSF